MSPSKAAQREFAASTLDIAMGLLPHSAPGKDREWSDAEVKAFCDRVGPLAGRISAEQVTAKISEEVCKLGRRAEHWSKVLRWLREIAHVETQQRETEAAETHTDVTWWNSLDAPARNRLFHYALGAYSEHASSVMHSDFGLGAEDFLARPAHGLDERSRRSRMVKLLGDLRERHRDLFRRWASGETTREEAEAEARGFYRWPDSEGGCVMQGMRNQAEYTEWVAARPAGIRLLFCRMLDREGLLADDTLREVWPNMDASKARAMVRRPVPSASDDDNRGRSPQRMAVAS